MAGYKIQANYDVLQQVMQKFAQKSDEAHQLQSVVNRCSGQLQSGDWIGVGAERFFQEMNDLVTPGMNRLISVLKDASSATKKISDALREAEEQAGGLFRGGNGFSPSPKPGNISAPTTKAAVVGSGLDADFFDDRRAAYKVGPATEVADYNFRSGKATALKYEVEIGGKKIPVYMPKNPDGKIGKFPTIDEVAKGLASLPESSRKLVTSVNVNPGKNPDDAMWAGKLKNFSGSYMTAYPSGQVDVYPTKNTISQSYLDGTMIHETGHTLSAQKWGDDDSKGAGWKSWKDAMAADKNQVSDYGSNNPSEDFSEALQQYMTYKGTKYEADARKLWPNRWTIIDTMVK